MEEKKFLINEINSIEENRSTIQQKISLGKLTTFNYNYTPKILSLSKFSQYFDHTLLSPKATKKQIENLCEDAIEAGCKTVCVPPYFLPFVAEKMKDLALLPITVIGFPLGYQTVECKVAETRQMIELGAEEIDMVINIAALKANDLQYLINDISMIVNTAGDVPVKVIVETCYLDQDEKIKAFLITAACKAAFIKTSTGFGSGGAEIEDIKLFSFLNTQFDEKDRIGIKASGGIKTVDHAKMFIRWGATRLGSSNSTEIIYNFAHKGKSH
jgi:deoxyribose-phosphate aldolase